MLIKLVSWNVNGLRAVLKKPDWDWFANNQCQIVGLQETKANPAQLPEEAVNPPWLEQLLGFLRGQERLFRRGRVLAS